MIPVYGESVYGEPLSDATGFVYRLDIQTGGHLFEVETVSNFAISDYTFDKDEKKLTLYITSGLENNLGEILLPQNLLGGDLTFYLNDQEYFPKTNINKDISFVTLDFEGSGDNKLEIFGTSYLSGLIEITPDLSTPDDSSLVYVAILILLVAGGVTVFIVRQRKILG